VQGMLDFDYVCSRKEPSVVAMIYPFVWVETNFNKFTLIDQPMILQKLIFTKR
jgi:hypothetical protein